MGAQAREMGEKIGKLQAERDQQQKRIAELEKALQLEKDLPSVPQMPRVHLRFMEVRWIDLL
jgi:hypothetical protein